MSCSWGKCPIDTEGKAQCEKHRLRSLELRKIAYHKNPEKYRNVARSSSRKKLYGLSPCEYTRLLIDQNGKCAICGVPETQVVYKTVKGLSVDHDHDTGKVRGLLCNNCNRGLGFLGDNLATLEAAVAYLKVGVAT